MKKKCFIDCSLVILVYFVSRRSWNACFITLTVCLPLIGPGNSLYRAFFLLNKCLHCPEGWERSEPGDCWGSSCLSEGISSVPHLFFGELLLEHPSPQQAGEMMGSQCHWQWRWLSPMREKLLTLSFLGWFRNGKYRIWSYFTHTSLSFFFFMLSIW